MGENETEDRAGEGAPEGRRPRFALAGLDPTRTDAWLRVALYVLAVVLAVIAVVFAATVWSDWREEQAATPATRTLKEVKALVRAKPNDADLRVRYGEALAAAGLNDEAVDQFNQALKVSPKHTGALIDLGRLAMQSGDWDAAEANFEKVVELSAGSEYSGIDERRELALFYLGEIALTQKRYEEAAGYFKAALRIRKDAADTYLELALAYRGMGKDDQAREQLEIALAFDPGMAQAHYELGDIFLKAGDEVKAAEQFGLAYSLAPDNQVVSDAVDSLGPVEKRIADARKALGAGDIAAAVESAHIAALLDPGSLDAALTYAQALEASGDAKAALAAYRAAEKIDPGDKTVADAIARLGGK